MGRVKGSEATAQTCEFHQLCTSRYALSVQQTFLPDFLEVWGHAAGVGS